MILFETERLRVRHFTADDKDNYYKLSGDFQVMQYIRAVKTKEESDQFLEQIMNDDKSNPMLGRWAAEDKTTGEFIGSFAIIPVPGLPGEIQLGYSLTPENWGKGYATELTKAGLNFFLDNYPLPRIYGVTEIPNTASQHVLLKAGFRSAGTMMENEKELLLFIVDRQTPSLT